MRLDQANCKIWPACQHVDLILCLAITVTQNDLSTPPHMYKNGEARQRSRRHEHLTIVLLQNQADVLLKIVITWCLGWSKPTCPPEQSYPLFSGACRGHFLFCCCGQEGSVLVCFQKVWLLEMNQSKVSSFNLPRSSRELLDDKCFLSFVEAPRKWKYIFKLHVRALNMHCITLKTAVTMHIYKLGMCTGGLFLYPPNTYT